MTSFPDFLATVARKAEDPDEKDEIYRLRRMAIQSVHLVDAGANKRTFLIRKDEEGHTMKTDDMIPGTEGITTADGVVITKQDAMAGACDDLRKLIAKMEEDENPPPFVAKLKKISAVLDKASTMKKAAEPPVDEEDEAKKKAKQMEGDEEDTDKKKSEGDPAAAAPAAPVAPAAPATPPSATPDPFDVILGQVDVIQKAGARMSKGNWELFSKAMEMLQKLSGNLTPEEKAKAKEKMDKIAKSVEPPPARIPDGNSNPNDDPVKPPEGGWSSYEDLNA